MQKLSILVADDDPVILRLLEERLTREDYNVVVAEDGYRAADLLNQERFDVVLTDLVMPGEMGGIEVLEIAKQLYPEIEVVLITAHSSVDTAVAAMKKGAADYLEKPINFDELMVRMEKIANMKNILRSARDIGQAMTITETQAASTIQDLEMRVTRMQSILDRVESILENEYEPEDSRIHNALSLLAEQ